MSEVEIQSTGDDQLPISRLPTTALQAIYHAVTGKTETMSKQLKGSVVIEQKDIDNLYSVLREQLRHYEMVCEPTVTIVVKCDNDKAITYSSWERFNRLRASHNDVTSEVILKIEAVIKLPEIDIPQRIILNAALDSSLPLLYKVDEEIDEIKGFGFFLFIRREWTTVNISIDFVDFLVARLFCGVIEEWFNGLVKIQTSKINLLLFKRFDLINKVFKELPRIGMAVFMASFAAFSASDQLTAKSIIVAISISLILWSVIAMLSSGLSNLLHKRIMLNIIPTVILLTEADDRAYSTVSKRRTSAITTMAILIGSTIFNIAVNILSSYIYSGS